MQHVLTHKSMRTRLLTTALILACALVCAFGFTAPAQAAETDVTKQFRDVEQGAWYTEHIQWAYDENVIQGYAPAYTIFGVGDPLVRQDFATILWRYCESDAYAAYDAKSAVGATALTTGEKLTGIDNATYWTQAANWTIDEGYITGFKQTNGSYDFGGSVSLSREQAVTVLWRMAGAPDADRDSLAGYPDIAQVDDWALTAFAWAVEQGVVNGVDLGGGKYELQPQASITREQLAKILHLSMVQEYKAGSYRVGQDIPAGEYKLTCTSNFAAYYCVYQDSSKSKILSNDNFSTCNYVTVSDGQLLEVSRATFVAIADATPTTSIEGDGVYKVGFDLKAGEYNIVQLESTSYMAYYCVWDSSNASSKKIVSNKNFDGNSYITVYDGQYLEITRATAQKS